MKRQQSLLQRLNYKRAKNYPPIPPMSMWRPIRFWLYVLMLWAWWAWNMLQAS